MFADYRAVIHVVAIILFGAASQFVVAQDAAPVPEAAVGSPSASSPSEPGDTYYYRMNLIRTLALGTAPFLNSQLAERARYAYSFDVSAIDTDEEWEWAQGLYGTVRLWPARLARDGLIQLPAEHYSENVTLKQIVGVWRAQGYSVLYLVEDESLLAGRSITPELVVSLGPIPSPHDGSATTAVAPR